ncbi:MAG: hypothetical protein ACOVJ8_01510 [Sediminibacterium sp.]
MSLKKIFNNVRKWVGDEYTDQEISGVLEAYYMNDVFYPEDFIVPTTRETLIEIDKKIYLQKVDELFSQITDEELVSQNMRMAIALHKITWGLVMVAKFGDKLHTTIPYDVKGNKIEVNTITSVDYPISLQKTKQLKDYLDSKKIHNPIVMYKDLRHTKAFLDLEDDIIGTALASYIESNGKATAEQIHKDIKDVFLSPSLNKRGGKL